MIPCATCEFLSITQSTHALQSLHAPALHPKTLKPKHPHEHTTQPPLPLLPALRINIQHDPALHTPRDSTISCASAASCSTRISTLTQHAFWIATVALSVTRPCSITHATNAAAAASLLAHDRRAAGALRRNVRTITRSTFEGASASFFAGKCSGGGWKHGGEVWQVRQWRVWRDWRDLHLLMYAHVLQKRTRHTHSLMMTS